MMNTNVDTKKLMYRLTDELHDTYKLINEKIYLKVAELKMMRRILDCGWYNHDDKIILNILRTRYLDIIKK